MNPKRSHVGIALAVAATLLLQLSLCYFFSSDSTIPLTNDINPSNYRTMAYRFPPRGSFSTDYWLGSSNDAVSLTVVSLLAHLPTWWFFTIFYPLCGAAAVFCFYLFLRELGLSAPVAVTGGLIYAWQGHLLSNIYPGHFAPAAMMAVFPLAGWSCLVAFRTMKWYPALLAGALTGMTVAMGADRGMLAALLIGLLFLAYAVRAYRAKMAGWWKVVVQFFLTVVIALLVAWPALQSVLGFAVAGVQQGVADDPRARYAWATQWSWPPEETITYLVPGFFGWRSGWPEGPYHGRIGRTDYWEDTHQGFRNFSLEASIIGTVPFLLFCLGLGALWRTKPRAGDEFAPLTSDQLFYGRFFAVMGLLSFLLGLGKYAPFYRFFYALPYMSTWRNPIKFLLVTGNFSFLVLAAYGVQMVATAFAAPSRMASARRVVTRVLMAAVVLLSAMLVWVIGSAGSRGSALAPLGYSPAEIQAILITQRATLLVALVVAALGLVGLLFFQNVIAAAFPEPMRSDGPKTGGQGRNPAWALPVFLAVLVVGQMYWVQTHYLEPFDFQRAYRTNPLLDKLKSSAEPVRVKVFAQDGLLHYYLSAVFPYDHIATVDIPAVSRMPDDYALFFRALEADPPRLWQLAGVKYLALPASLLQRLMGIPALRANVAAAWLYQASGSRLDDLRLQPVGDLAQATHALIELKDYLPKALLVPGLEILPDDDAEQKRMAAPDWNPRSTMLVTRAVAQAAGLAADVPPGKNEGSVRLHRYTDTAIEVDASSGSAGLLLVNDHYDGTWKAWVNGRETPVFRANLVMRGLALPAGQSHIVMRLERPVLGHYVSLATYVLVGLLALTGCKRS